jgi:tetratricopeptide (TPR) repeat protein
MKGRIYMSQSDMKNASVQFSKAIQLKKDYAEAYYMRGVSKAMQQKYEQSLTDFSLAIKYDKNYFDAYLGRATSLGILERHDEALADYDYYLKHVKNNGSAFLNRGVSRINVDNTKGGCEDFKKALELGVEKAQDMLNMYCSKYK